MSRVYTSRDPIVPPLPDSYRKAQGKEGTCAKCLFASKDGIRERKRKCSNRGYVSVDHTCDSCIVPLNI